MAIIDKKRVNQNFSRGAKTYDNYAQVQKHMADKLEIFVHGSKKQYNILEVGCGTGIFSQKILKRFPNSKIDLLDISPAMVETAKEKLGDSPNLNFIVEDVENYNPEKKYDLIFSNATFQWIDDQMRLFNHLYSLLDYGGKIAFSTFGNKTYFELRESLSTLDPELKYSQKFVKLDEMTEITNKNFRILAADEDFFIEKFENVMAFLKAIKGIGSNSALSNKRNFTREKFKALDKIYRDKFGDKNIINVTNHLLYMVLEKVKMRDENLK
ncbi:malonyl-ACP O-methyltransferase BioC [Ilyobacter polytropus]|uniref:Malonyl-[acyl-carrier protein] O-methyltransferase 1 n=1 Tax=Ilyobacter polytropus (strain ATCC 51220 / DSM 2926 / LMG 16218 / CuHBu1) TaxID=572544 RepID=BIOC1_ILYPC|nr:malonyl-ACP O-methyltransferase BioC [Ilyobacter polytropus]E3H9W1.1 RecName: Full=Malonyl-[acyl-carrier protein] O-methyltransferase 1; Short=Malonyl-ACP O-methyltransferase 1; AltName: Full=Biotin synthesis protein BioC 1 [Ilyobacter polytropus DSM 2926]ADO82018.1 Methyltransferase type 12 [Ilyobacter polytropus DSM 2926]